MRSGCVFVLMHGVQKHIYFTLKATQLCLVKKSYWILKECCFQSNIIKFYAESYIDFCVNYCNVV